MLIDIYVIPLFVHVRIDVLNLRNFLLSLNKLKIHLFETIYSLTNIRNERRAESFKLSPVPSLPACCTLSLLTTKKILLLISTLLELLPSLGGIYVGSSWIIFFVLKYNGDLL